MEFATNEIFVYLRQNFFYDLRSSILSICAIIAFVYFIKLSKDKGDKIKVTLKYLTCIIVCFSIFVLLY